jgi:glycosyltransferase involved in cell wall biosynthesis
MDRPMKRVLVVAYYFPPIGGIGAIRMAKFCEYLPAFGWEPTVLAPRDTPHPQDPELTVREDHVIRSRSIELSRLGRAVPGAGAGSPGAAPAGFSLRQAVRRAVHRFVFYPDAQIGWYPDAVRKGAAALADGGFDAIYSSSNPMTAHLVARTLHRRSGLPWVAELRDPWSDRLGADHPYRRHARRLERALAAEADRIVVPTPTMAARLEELWDREIDLVMNGHDLDGTGVVPPDRPTLTHVGTYYPGRQDLRALWEAVRRLRDADGTAPRLRFVGDLPVELRRELDRFGLLDLVEVTGFVSHDAAMDAMRSSSMLIASGFAGQDPFSRGVIPAKTFEYLASGLPILYLGSTEDDTWQLLAGEPGCHLVERHDVDAAVTAIGAGLRQSSHPRDAGRHTRRARTEALARILDAAAGGADGRH